MITLKASLISDSRDKYLRAATAEFSYIKQVGLGKVWYNERNANVNMETEEPTDRSKGRQRGCKRLILVLIIDNPGSIYEPIYFI